MQARQVLIPPLGLDGTLTLPRNSLAVVLFAHGSGSSRLSPRNVRVSTALCEAGLGTLLFDLLTEDEAADRANVFDIGLLADRLLLATNWLRTEAGLQKPRIGYFGASTGAAAALVAAAHAGNEVGAVVSRGGRPDLAGEALAKVKAPTLLIVGGDDDVVVDLNRAALTRLRCEKKLEIVPGATHLFEEPGTLEQVMALAQNWFCSHLIGEPERRRHV